mgnify:CR=1 FL=1
MRIAYLIATAGALAALTVSSPAQAQTGMPNHPDAGHVMGFDMDKTVHHFYLYEDVDGIRKHLMQLSQMFGHGDMEMPAMVHETHAMPGLEDLAKLKDKINYTYKDTAQGGRVEIVTKDKDALKAVHAFLKYQIADHKTGEKTDVTKRGK